MNQYNNNKKIINMDINNNIREIKNIIKERQIRQDKFGKDYLLLKLENQETLFVFINKNITKDRLDYLAIGEEFIFTVKEGLNGSNVLIDFEPELGIFA
jgi:hypothetical protein